MKSLSLLATLLALQTADATTGRWRRLGNTTDERDLPVVRDGTELKLNGRRWTASGANVYWLGLDENVIPPAGEPFYAPFNASYPTKGRITEAMRVLNVLGATVIRSQTLGISVGNPLSVEPERGVWNDKAFDTIDWSVYQARQHNIRLMVPLIDNYDYYHGGKFVFLRWRGFNITGSSDIAALDTKGYPIVQHFYTNAGVVSDFKDYITHLLTHRNPYTNLTYAEDTTIYAIETGNELGGPHFGDMWVPNSWTKDIATHLRSLAPQKLIIDGTSGINSSHFEVQDIDVFSNHYYPLDIKRMTDDIAKVEAANRVYSVGEYDWTGKRGANMSDFFGVIEAQQKKAKPVVVGDLFWSLFGHNVPDCTHYVNHSDGYTLHYGSPSNTALENHQIATVQEHLWRMRGVHITKTLQNVTCPGPLRI